VGVDAEKTVTFGLQVWTLEYTTAALLRSEEIIKRSPGEIISDAREGALKFSELAVLLWAGLQKHHRKEFRTVDALVAMIKPRELMSLKTISAIVEALNACYDMDDIEELAGADDDTADDSE